MSMTLRCRPLSIWPPEFSRQRENHDRFRAPWSDTLALLERELDKLGARDAVIEIALDESEIRLDGRPRAGARPRHPGVIVSFDSRYGPLRYGTDTFRTWQANVRAIALGLQDLRRVDRYGIGKRGEQYQGYRQLGSGAGDDIARGRELIAKHGSARAALQATHPDHGGDADDFRAVQAARQA